MAYRPRTVIAAFLLILALVLGTTEAALSSSQTRNTRLFLREFVDKFPNQLSSWTGDDYCTWSGVSCDASGKVTVDLSNRGLTGEMPEINDRYIDGSQVMVVKIDLSHNAGLYDDFEQDWKRLTNLEYLDLSYTSLDGSLPGDWSKMTSLRTLKISNTRACKSLPQWKMPALVEVDLSNNRLTGELKSDWAKMTKLQTVNLGGNNFCGCMPSDWKKHPVLEKAISSYTAVTAPTCKNTNRCTRDRTNCDKTNNPIAPTTTTTAPVSSSTSAPVPTNGPSAYAVYNTRLFLREFAKEFPNQLSSWTGDDYCTWSGVSCDVDGSVTLDLSNRGLTGEMPEINDNYIDGSQVMVVKIDLSHNAGLYDNFEQDWKRLTNLEYLDLSYTSLDGSLPSDWSKMTSLRTLKISNTRACKSLPQWKMPALVEVDLSNNRLTGELKSDWAKMTKLQTVNLGGNNFCGCMPSDWKGISVLEKAISSYTAVTAPTCKNTNRCTRDRTNCDKTSNPIAPTTTTTAPVSSSTSPSSSSSTTSTSTSAPVPTNGPSAYAVYNTRLFLREFAKEFPNQLSSWTGDDYCTWSGVSCDVDGSVTLDLSNRGLTGEMPEVDHIDGSQVVIKRIDLSHNAGLYDSFEQNWKRLTNLEYLDLSYTSLEGQLPDDWRQMTSLVTLKISNTRACKSLPQWTMPALVEVDLSNNRLTGSLKSEWSQMTKLRTVNLGGNNFCGCMPSDWKGISVLEDAISSYTAVTSLTCSTDNACTIFRFMCDKS